MENNMEKKKIDLMKIFEKLRMIPEDKLDYAAGVVEGMSIAYNSAIDKSTSGKTA